MQTGSTEVFVGHVERNKKTMNPEITIRSETNTDIGVIAEVTIAAFKTLEISNHTELRIPVMSSIDSGHVVHPRDRSGASIDIIQSSGRHGQGRTEFAL